MELPSDEEDFDEDYNSDGSGDDHMDVDDEDDNPKKKNN